MLTSSKKTSFTYLRRVAVLPLLVVTCVLFAFGFKKEKMALQKDKTINDFTTIKKLGSENLENKNRISDELINTDFQDTAKNKNRRNKSNNSADKTIKISDVIFIDSAGKETTISATVAYSAKDTEKLKKELVILDGKEIMLEDINKIDPPKVLSITVLNSEEAVKRYGVRGNNGAIEIISVLTGNPDKKYRKYTEDQQKYMEEQKTYLEEQQKYLEKQQKYIINQNNHLKEQHLLQRVFTIVENPPYYPKGMFAFAEYINSSMQYPKEAIQNKMEGAVLIQCIVNEEGKLTDFKKLSDKGYGLEEEAIRLLKNSGDWNPGIQNGHKVPVQIQQQIIFQLPKSL